MIPAIIGLGITAVLGIIAVQDMRNLNEAKADLSKLASVVPPTEVNKYSNVVWQLDDAFDIAGIPTEKTAAPGSIPFRPVFPPESKPKKTADVVPTQGLGNKKEE